MMQPWVKAFQPILQMFLKSSCALCERATEQELCEDCWRRVKQCELSQRDCFWQNSVPLLPWGVYQGGLKRAIATLKYNNQPQIARLLGYELAEAWRSSSHAKQSVVVVPIPIHPSKLKQRGYNQAELLADAFCQITRLPLERQGLVRVRATEAQFGLSAGDRARNMSSAFEPGTRFLQKPPPQPVLLIDDIYTTGATAQTSAESLREHGVQVYGMAAVAVALKESARPSAH